MSKTAGSLDSAEVILSVRVQPRASRNAARLQADGSLKVHLTAPAIEGRANEALVDLLSDLLRIPKRSLEIVAGRNSRSKRVRVLGLDRRSVDQRLSQAPTA